jgi:hypothetical protein
MANSGRCFEKLHIFYKQFVKTMVLPQLEEELQYYSGWHWQTSNIPEYSRLRSSLTVCLPSQLGP